MREAVGVVATEEEEKVAAVRAAVGLLVGVTEAATAEVCRGVLTAAPEYRL